MSLLITSLPNAPVLRSTDYLIVVVPNIITVADAADATIDGTLYELSAANGTYELAADGKYYNTGDDTWYILETTISGVLTYLIGHTTLGFVWTLGTLDGTYARTSAWPVDVTDVTVTSTTGLFAQTCKATLAEIVSAGEAITPDP